MCLSENHGKYSPRLRGAGDLDFPVHQLHGALDDGKPQAVALLGGTGLVAAVEAPKDMGQILRGDHRAEILHCQYRLASAACQAHRAVVLCLTISFSLSALAEGPGGNPPSVGPGGGPGGPDGPGGGPGGSASSVTYTAATEISSADTLTDGIYLSDSADENAILIDTDETVTLTNATVTKSGDSDGGDSYITSFTGDASQIISNGYTLYVNGVALEGTK